jgi:hypothetical protein
LKDSLFKIKPIFRMCIGFSEAWGSFPLMS